MNLHQINYFYLFLAVACTKFVNASCTNIVPHFGASFFRKFGKKRTLKIYMETP